MAEEQQPQGLSKSAKRRQAAKRAKEAAAAEEPKEEAAPPAPAPAKAPAKAPPAAAEPKAKAKAKAKAEPAAEPKAEPKPEPKAAPAKAAAAKPAAKAEGKAKPAAKTKAKAAPKPVEEEPPKRDPSPERFVQLDDGTGPDWEVSTGLTKRQQKRKDRVEAEKAEAKATGLKPGQAPQYIPGMGPAPDAKAGPAASQAVAATKEQVAAMAVAAAQAAAEKAAAAAAAESSNTSTATVKVPDQKIGIVIGPKGSRIKLIQEKTGARIDTTGDVFTITGPPAGVSMAETAVKELVEKGYCAMEYDDFSENFVAVHPSYFPEIIGKGGVVIRKIKDELGVSVKIPEAPKNPPAGKKYKVILAGSNQAVEKAKDVINEIMMYYHHPVTHEGYVHEEVEVAQWAYSFIIGKAGSELRHIQNNYKVKMNIPREHSVNQKVVIVGEPYGVERAKVYVEKLVWNAEHMPRGRGATDQAEDVWGDEGEIEPWMKDYIYKR